MLNGQTCNIVQRGDTLFAPESQSYQWVKEGVDVPGATLRYYLPTEDGDYTVRLRSLASDPFPYSATSSVVVTGAVLDEFLRPVSGVEVTVRGVKATTDAKGRFYVTAQRAPRLTARAQIVGFHSHTVGFMPTAGDTQFVYVHLAKQVVTHKLPAVKGGTVSHDGFWLTLPPNSVATADGNLYSGEVQLSVVARRPGDRDFAQRMPGGDFMAKDKTGAEKILNSYGFTGVELTTADGKPLNLAAGQSATIEFLITPEQRPDAPEEMPLWHFDETAGLWVEAGVMKKEGLTYKAQVGHFSWWNCDFPYPRAYVEGRIVNCWGKPLAGVQVWIGGSLENGMGNGHGCTDEDGRFKGGVPAGMKLWVKVEGSNIALEPLTPEEHLDLGDVNLGWGAFQAYGLADKNNILTVYTFGDTDGLEYSLDGAQWQSEPVFVLPNDSVPPFGWVRLVGCDTIRFNNYAPVGFNDCYLFGDVELLSMPWVYQPLELIQAAEPVYKVTMYNQTPDISPWVAAAGRQSCVQTLALYNWAQVPGMAAELTALTGFWPNVTTLNYYGIDTVGSNQILEAVTGFSRLEWLSVNNIGCTQAPASIGNLTHMVDLNLSNNRLADLPESFGNLTALKNINLSSNQLPVLPASFGNLTNLENLQLSGNQLTDLPDSFQNLTNLKSLLLGGSNRDTLAEGGNGGNLLTVLPDWFGNLTSLQELRLSANQLTTLPTTFGNLTGLTILSLDSNKLAALPNAIVNLTNLTRLNLGGNLLTSVPAGLGNLTALTLLNLSRNKLTAAPDGIGNLTGLTELGLADNQLTALPDEIGNLTNLQTLALENNLLTSIPDDIGNLTGIWQLNLSNNQLTTLPDAIANLSNSLSYLTLTGNPIAPEEQTRIRAMLPNTQITF